MATSEWMRESAAKVRKRSNSTLSDSLTNSGLLDGNVRVDVKVRKRSNSTLSDSSTFQLGFAGWQRPSRCAVRVRRKKSNSDVDDPRQEPNQCSQSQQNFIKTIGAKGGNDDQKQHERVECGLTTVHACVYGSTHDFNAFVRSCTSKCYREKFPTNFQLTPIRIHMYTFCRIFDYDLQDSYDVTKTSPELHLIGFVLNESHYP
jgi:hypothetical protein